MPVRIVTLLLLAPLLLTPPAPAQTDELIRARHLERVAHQPEDALPLYEQLAGNHDLLTPARQEAFLGFVRCLLKLGRLDEALAWQSAMPAGLDPKQTEPGVINLLGEYLPSAPQNNAAVLGPRVHGLIEALSGENANEVRESLIHLGDLVEPYLVTAVRTTTDPTVREKVIQILAKRLEADPPGEPTVQLLNTLDPAAEPVLALEMLQNIPHRSYPSAVNKFLDRCAATDVPA